MCKNKKKEDGIRKPGNSGDMLEFIIAHSYVACQQPQHNFQPSATYKL